jgi:hypothetical protein
MSIFQGGRLACQQESDDDVWQVEALDDAIAYTSLYFTSKKERKVVAVKTLHLLLWLPQTTALLISTCNPLIEAVLACR